MNPIKIPVFYYKANGHIPHTFIFDDDELGTHVWGIPELEYKGLVKVRFLKFVYSEKATKICEISTLDLTVTI